MTRKERSGGNTVIAVTRCPSFKSAGGICTSLLPLPSQAQAADVLRKLEGVQLRLPPQYVTPQNQQSQLAEVILLHLNSLPIYLPYYGPEDHHV